MRIALVIDENGKMGTCKRRNVVYETYCVTCYEKERRQKEEKDIYRINVDEGETGTETKKRKRKSSESKDEKKEKTREKKVKKEYNVKYVGETGRSAYERGVEHISDYQNFDESSHMLKHYLSCHKDMKMKDVKFGMKVRNSFRSALERQVGEAVAIDVDRRKGMILMNSKSEYNRCTIPRICTKSEKEKQEENEKVIEDE